MTTYRDQYTPKPVTDIFTADTDIDRRQCKRTVPMRVMCLGLGRTGTACEWLPKEREASPDTDSRPQPCVMLCASSASTTLTT